MMKIISSRKFHPFPSRTIFATVLLALVALTLFGCKKKVTPAAANAQADEFTAAIAGAPAIPAARHIADGTNVSVDGGNSYAHITYAPAVKMLEHSEVESLSLIHI